MKLLSVDNVKTRKGESQGYLTAVLHLAPHTLSGSNMCPKASAGCSATCLNTAGKGVNPHIQLSRIRRTEEYLADRDGFMKKLRADLRTLARKADREGLRPAARLNATSDQPKLAMKMAEEFPGIQFYDYTKIKEVFAMPWPTNYYATFSRSETNADECVEILESGFNVAAVFEHRPAYYEGYEVLNGDRSDLRFLDKRGCVVGLSAKGRGKRDKTGFVIRDRSTMIQEEVRCACGERIIRAAFEWAKEHKVEYPPRCLECLELVFERKPAVLESLRAAVRPTAAVATKPVGPEGLDARILVTIREKDLHTYALIADELNDAANEVFGRLHYLVAQGHLVDVAGQPNRYYIPGTEPDKLPKERNKLEPTCEECGGPRLIGSAKKCRKCYTAKSVASNGTAPAEPKKRGGRKPAPCIVCGGEREAGPEKRCGTCFTAGAAVDVSSNGNGLTAPPTHIPASPVAENGSEGSEQPIEYNSSVESDSEPKAVEGADDPLHSEAARQKRREYAQKYLSDLEPPVLGFRRVEEPAIASQTIKLSTGLIHIGIYCDLFKATPIERDLIEGIIQLVQAYEVKTA